MHTMNVFSILTVLTAGLAQVHAADDWWSIIKPAGNIVITDIGVKAETQGYYKGWYRFPVDDNGNIETAKKNFKVELKDTKMQFECHFDGHLSKNQAGKQDAHFNLYDDKEYLAPCGDILSPGLRLVCGDKARGTEALCTGGMGRTQPKFKAPPTPMVDNNPTLAAAATGAVIA